MQFCRSTFVAERISTLGPSCGSGRDRANSIVVSSCDATLSAAGIAPGSGGSQSDRGQAHTGATHGKQANDPQWDG